MAAELVAEQLITVGKPVIVEAESPSRRYCVVFEDDGDTGYLYAVEVGRSEQSILDAMHIYNVHNVTDRHKPSTIRIGWSRDGLKALLTINDYPHAVFDFQSQNGYCRTGFPPSNESWSLNGHAWSDEALALFE